MFYLLCSFFSYIIGILVYDKVSQEKIFIYIPLITIFLGLSEYHFKKTKFFIFLTLVFTFIFIGANWYKYSLPKPENNDLFYYTPQKNIKIQALIISEPKIDENKTSFEINSEIVLEPYISLSAGKILVNIYDKNLELEYGDRVEINGNLDLPPKAFNPNEFSYKKYLEQKGIFSFISANKVSIIEKNTVNNFQYFIIKIRKSILNKLYNSMPQESANIISSLVFGAKATPVSKDIRDDFNTLGLSHILAASGMQITLIMTTGLLFIRFARINKLFGLILTIITIIFYIFMTGFPMSIIRAGLLNIIILLIRYKRETPDTYKVLSIVTFIILLFSPLSLFDIGLQFSILATLGLLYISKPLEEKLIFLPTFLSSTVAMILSAQIMVLPLQLYHFGQFSYLFLPSNLIAVLFVDLLTYMSIATIILSFIIPFIGNTLGYITYFILSFFIKIVEFLSLLPYAIFYIKKLDIFFVILSYIFILFITEILKENIIKLEILKQNKFMYLISIQIFLLSIILFNNLKQLDELDITFINVKQGDSTLIVTPENKTFLIDCGSSYSFIKDNKEISFNASEKYIIPYLRHNGIKKIDTLVITHPDLDHIGGCESIIDNFKVLEVWDSGQKDSSEIYSNLLTKIVKKNINLKVVNYNDNYQEKDLKIRVINKINPNDLNSKAYNNNNAIALRLDYKKNSFLFMSDLEKESEEKLLTEDINVQTLKVGHHGSLTSSTDQFLLMSRPQYSVISAGKNNRYKHPREEILERLKYFGSKIYRTDEDGGVLFKINGNKLDIITSE
ncbi:MAG: DNA internalization-related competence protein ComEC/Rec2 [Candidatus Sericytochromatia bacterium]